MKKHLVSLWGILILVTACTPLPIQGKFQEQSHRKSASELSEKEEVLLEKIGLLPSDEDVLFFNTTTGLKHDGSFFTSKRVAYYWIDNRDRPAKTRKNSALYTDIAEISLRYAADWSYAHDITVTRHDGSRFHVYVGSDQAFADSFFEQLTQQWQQANGT